MGFPTSSDIYLEMDGKKAAVVQSYIAKSGANGQYHIELDRVYITNEVIRGGLDFHELEDFSLVICKPDRKIIYSGCQWSAIGENGTLESMSIDRMSITAKHREEARP